MKILILGLGNVGKALAASLRQNGHQVKGTTMLSRKAALMEFADEVVVLCGAERENISRAAAGLDVIVVTVAPNVRRALGKEQREAAYGRSPC